MPLLQQPNAQVTSLMQLTVERTKLEGAQQ